MAEANWFWAKDGQQNGPVEGGAIAKLVADATLGADDLIWKEGMAEWIPVSRVPALAKYLQKSAANPAGTPVEPAPVEATVEPTPIQETAPTTVGYYNPSGTLPPRAAATLSKHAKPRGDVGDWPLDDAQVAQFDAALKLRKRIDGAASLFRLLFLIIAIADVAGIFVALAMVSNPRGPAGAMIGIFVGGLFYAGLTALYYFAWKGTVRSQAWAPLTMGILFSLGALFYVGMIALAQSNSRGGDATAILIGGSFGVLLVGAFAYVSFRAYAAIPRYLRQPAWCQELLSKTSGK